MAEGKGIGPPEKAVPLVFSAAWAMLAAVPLVFGQQYLRDSFRAGRRYGSCKVVAKGASECLLRVL